MDTLKEAQNTVSDSHTYEDEDDASTIVEHHVRGGVDTGAGRPFRRDHLDKKLKREHITGIAFSGTIGIGLFIASGQYISIGGSLGCVIGFLVAGIIVIGVMRSLAEMVSIRPFATGLIEFPHTFVDEALGFAVGVTYCLAQCMSMASLIAAAAKIADSFYHDPTKKLPRSQLTGVLVALCFLTLISNLCGVRLYGNLERIFKWIKIITIIALCILMIIINRGVGGYSTAHASQNYTTYPIPPTFNPGGWNKTNHEESIGIPGPGGQFLSVWVCITLAMFPSMGGDMVIMTAGEAQKPRQDLPTAARFMYLAPITFYVLGSFLLGFNINYFADDLGHPYVTMSTSQSDSPFVIVLSSTSLAPHVFPTVFQALFLFSAWSAANTALFVSSRTLFALARTYGNNFFKTTVGVTNNGHTPQNAIFVCSLFTLLSFLVMADETFDQPILCLSSFFTGSIACVYASECLAFLRFFYGFKHQERENFISRDDDEYRRKHYRAHWQPTCAIVGLVGSLLIMLFSGWPVIYIMAARGSLPDNELLRPNHILAWDLVGSYSGPLFFVLVYLSWKWFQNTHVRTAMDIKDKYFVLQYEDESDLAGYPIDTVKGWIKEAWSLIK